MDWEKILADKPPGEIAPTASVRETVEKVVNNLTAQRNAAEERSKTYEERMDKAERDVIAARSLTEAFRTSSYLAVKQRDELAAKLTVQHGLLEEAWSALCKAARGALLDADSKPLYALAERIRMVFAPEFPAGEVKVPLAQWVRVDVSEEAPGHATVNKSFNTTEVIPGVVESLVEYGNDCAGLLRQDLGEVVNWRREAKAALAGQPPESEVVARAVRELKSALKAHGQFHSAHEGWAVLLEEVDELWEHVRKKRSERSFVAMRDEAVQIAAMGLKFAMWCEEREEIPF